MLFLYFSNEYTYQGEYQNGLRHGFGCITYVIHSNNHNLFYILIKSDGSQYTG